jgi:hypothetical protein
MLASRLVTVRTWVTLSVLVLVALTVAVFARFLAPVDAPPVLLRVGQTRIEGARDEANWPQRGGDLRYEEQDRESPADVPTIPREGEFRIVVAFPAQPEDGTIEIERNNERGDEERVLREDWTDDLRYELEPGSYTLLAYAEYPDDAFVRYRFGFLVR